MIDKIILPYKYGIKKEIVSSLKKHIFQGAIPKILTASAVFLETRFFSV
jgi:hypothetical protein